MITTENICPTYRLTRHVWTKIIYVAIHCVIILAPSFNNFTNLLDSATRRKKRAVTNPTSDPGTYNFDHYEEEEEGIEDPDSLDTDFKDREQMIMIMAEAEPEDVMPYGHQFEDFVLSCTYRGVSCG